MPVLMFMPVLVEFAKQDNLTSQITADDSVDTIFMTFII